MHEIVGNPTPGWLVSGTRGSRERAATSLGGDIYIFQRGDGQDVFSERGGVSHRAAVAANDTMHGVERHSALLRGGLWRE